MLCAGALLRAVTSGAWIHGSPPRYANWREALANISCQNILKDSKELKVIGPLIVDGKSYQDRIITNDEEIDAVEKRCSLKG